MNRYLKRVFVSAIATITTGLALLLPATAQKLSPPEIRISKFVDAHNQKALALLERVVNMNSGTMNFDGVRRVGDVFAKELSALGFETRWEDGEDFNRAGHLFAERAGGDLHLLLIGHLDTVFEPDSPFQKFERVDKDTVRGPGIVDMKGGDVIIVYALKALQAIGALDQVTVTVALIGDEERPGHPVSLGRKSLIEAARVADIAIAFENGDNNPATAVVSRRGSTKWRLRVHGKPFHSSQVFREDIGAGAIYEASRILNSFREELSGEQYLTFNPGLILGGTSVDYDSTQSRGNAFGKSNVIAEHAVVSGDLRTVSAEQHTNAVARMRDIVSKSLPHTSAEITFQQNYPPMAPTDANRQLLERLNQVSQALGYGEMVALDPSAAGAADVAFTAGHVEMALDGIGLLGDAEHTENEWADLRTLPMQTKRTALLIYRLAREWNSN